MKSTDVLDYWKSNFSFKGAKEISFELLADKSDKRGITRKSLALLVTGRVIRYS